MSKNAGVWIDERKAVIVRFIDGNEEIHSILFDVKKNSNGSEKPSVEKQDLLFPNQLKEYYEKIIALIQNVDAVLILGPGMAKVELGIRLKGDTLGDHLAGIENEEAMTDVQITARVRKHFLAVETKV